MYYYTWNNIVIMSSTVYSYHIVKVCFFSTVCRPERVFTIRLLCWEILKTLLHPKELFQCLQLHMWRSQDLKLTFKHSCYLWITIQLLFLNMKKLAGCNEDKNCGGYLKYSYWHGVLYHSVSRLYISRDDPNTPYMYITKM